MRIWKTLDADEWKEKTKQNKTENGNGHTLIKC